MKKSRYLPIIIAWLALGCAPEAPHPTATFDAVFGVWADNDSELVQTGRFVLWFERDGSKLFSSLAEWHQAGETLIVDTRAAVILDSIGQRFSGKAKDVLSGEEVLMDIDSAAQLTLLTRRCLIKNGAEGLSVVCGGDTLETLTDDAKQLIVVSPGGVKRTLHLVEKINPVSAYDMPKATGQTIGACLQEWPLGTRALKFNDTYTTGVTITTNEHAYVFSYGGMIYCRAARIRSNNAGTVFAQNIRMMYKPGEFTAAMDANNGVVSSQPITIIDSLFDPRVCIYAADGIYWSLKRFDDSTIVVNGCGGEDYITSRPGRDDPQLLEWFAFRDYGSAH